MASNSIPPCLDPASTPDTIEARSFAIIDAETGDPKPFSGDAWHIARRLVHTSGDVSLLSSLYLPDTAITAGLKALVSGAPVFTDTEMAKAGMPLRRLTPFGVTVSCILAEPGVDETAAATGVTRSRAGIVSLGPRLSGSILAVGNAPTALLALMDCLDAGVNPPALVIAMPVGFVNAAESKEMLINRGNVPCLAVHGRRGGSPLAAATINALACLLAERGTS